MISQVFSAILCLIQLLRTHESYRLSIADIRFDVKMLKQIIRIGLPSGVQNSIIAFANVVVQSYINAFGEMAMAGYGAYSKNRRLCLFTDQQLYHGHDHLCGARTSAPGRKNGRKKGHGSAF